MRKAKKDSFEVGAPIEGTFRHVAHVGYDAEHGFDMSQLPREWALLFKAAGVRRRDLADPETRRVVMQTVFDMTGASFPTETSDAGAEEELPPLAPVAEMLSRHAKEDEDESAAAASADAAAAVPPPIPKTRPVSHFCEAIPETRRRVETIEEEEETPPSE